MNYIIADAHTDYLSLSNRDTGYIDVNVNAGNHVSREGMLDGGIGLQIFAAFTDSGKNDPTIGALEQISTFSRISESWGNVHLLNPGNVNSIGADDNIYAVLAIEGGEALMGNDKLLDCFYMLGVRLITLTWNHENEIGYPASSGSERGLKPFGRYLIKLMNDYGMAVDVSHLNIGGFWNAIELSSKPIMASHSNARALCDHVRNLNDDQIKAIIESNGYIGINFYTEFLAEDRESSLADIVKHVHYILDMGGQDILGFGSDFDGITSMPWEISGVQHFQLIMNALEESGIDETTLHKISSGNLVRYLSDVIL